MIWSKFCPGRAKKLTQLFSRFHWNTSRSLSTDWLEMLWSASRFSASSITRKVQAAPSLVTEPLATRTSLRQSYPRRKQTLQTSPYIIHGSVLITRINLLTVARQTTSRLLNLHADIKDRQSSMERASGGVCVTVFDVELLVTLQLYHWAVMPGRDAGIWGDASNGQVNHW